MFETVLKSLLARYLGRYVDVRDLSAASLKASVWSGEVVLRLLAVGMPAPRLTPRDWRAERAAQGRSRSLLRMP